MDNDLSSIDSAAGTSVGDEEIPVAIPVGEPSGAAAAAPSSVMAGAIPLDDPAPDGDGDGDSDGGADSEAEADADAASGDASGILDTTLDTADGDDEADVASHATDLTPPPPSSKKRKLSEAGETGEGDPSAAVPADAETDSAKKKKYNDGKPRQPAAKGLTIPFRTIKRIMKMDATIGIVQNDAAIVTTAALELFVKKMAEKSLELAKKKGRNTIKYDDVAEARAGDRSLSFLDLLLP